MELRQTEDGSSTLYVAELHEHYHSTHGAVQESQHVFIQAGFNYSTQAQLRIFEVGFGTGLNALLTAIEAERQQRPTHYYSVEKFPVPIDLVRQLNYTAPQSAMAQWAEVFERLHTAEWNADVRITPWFTLHKINGDATCQQIPDALDLVYFDAFAPDKQPEMWNEQLFLSIYNAMLYGASLLTYCAKGALKRTLRAVGFTVVGLPGPPGKREMTRAERLGERA